MLGLTPIVTEELKYPKVTCSTDPPPFTVPEYSDSFSSLDERSLDFDPISVSIDDQDPVLMPHCTIKAENAVRSSADGAECESVQDPGCEINSENICLDGLLSKLKVADAMVSEESLLEQNFRTKDVELNLSDSKTTCSAFSQEKAAKKVSVSMKEEFEDSDISMEEVMKNAISIGACNGAFGDYKLPSGERDGSLEPQETLNSKDKGSEISAPSNSVHGEGEVTENGDTEYGGSQGRDDEIADENFNFTQNSLSSSSSSSSSSSDEDEVTDDDDVEDHESREISDCSDLEEGEIRDHKLEYIAPSNGHVGEGAVKRLIKPKTETEILPPVPPVDVVLEPHHRVLPVGVISSIIGAKVIVEGTQMHNPLSEGSILWITETKLPLGLIDEIFGPVKFPYYIVRYNSEDEVPRGICQGIAVSFVAEFANCILSDEILNKKGYDVSSENDEEFTDEVEFSDDEKEAEYNRLLKLAKGKDNRRRGIQEFGDVKRVQVKGGFEENIKHPLPIGVRPPGPAGTGRGMNRFLKLGKGKDNRRLRTKEFVDKKKVQVKGGFEENIKHPPIRVKPPSPAGTDRDMNCASNQVQRPFLPVPPRSTGVGMNFVSNQVRSPLQGGVEPPGSVGTGRVMDFMSNDVQMPSFPVQPRSAGVGMNFIPSDMQCLSISLPQVPAVVGMNFMSNQVQRPSLPVPPGSTGASMNFVPNQVQGPSLPMPQGLAGVDMNFMSNQVQGLSLPERPGSTRVGMNFVPKQVMSNQVQRPSLPMPLGPMGVGMSFDPSQVQTPSLHVPQGPTGVGTNFISNQVQRPSLPMHPHGSGHFGATSFPNLHMSPPPMCHKFPQKTSILSNPLPVQQQQQSVFPGNEHVVNTVQHQKNPSYYKYQHQIQPQHQLQTPSYCPYGMLFQPQSSPSQVPPSKAASPLANQFTTSAPACLNGIMSPGCFDKMPFGGIQNHDNFSQPCTGITVRRDPNSGLCRPSIGQGGHPAPQQRDLSIDINERRDLSSELCQPSVVKDGYSTPRQSELSSGINEQRDMSTGFCQPSVGQGGYSAPQQRDLSTGINEYQPSVGQVGYHAPQQFSPGMASNRGRTRPPRGRGSHFSRGRWSKKN